MGNDRFYKASLNFQIKRKLNGLIISIKYYGCNEVIVVPWGMLESFKTWMCSLIDAHFDNEQLELPTYTLYFNLVNPKQKVGLFKVTYPREDSYSAYVNPTEFLRSLYLAIATELAFGNSWGAEAEDRESLMASWAEYNRFRSPELERYVTDKYFNITADGTHPVLSDVNECYIMFPDYSDCIFWNTSGVGCGDYDCLCADNGDIQLNVPGLKEWSECYGSFSSKKSFDDFWNEGLRLALEVRKQLPNNIELFYMCFDPQEQDKPVDYNCWLPRIVVPRSTILT